MRSLNLFLCNILLAVALAGNAAATSARPASAANHAVTPSDAEIESTIRTKLAKSKIGKDGFKFHVAHGVVTWEGSTAVMQHKGSATRMAHAAGAAKVVNNIQVTGGAKPMKKAEVVQ
jgi:BON domain